MSKTLSAQQKKLVEGVKKVIIKKVQSGSGLSSVIGAVIKFIEKIGIPVTKLTWNLFILPMVDLLFLKKLPASQRDTVIKFLKIGRGGGRKGRKGMARACCLHIIRARHRVIHGSGLKLAGQGLVLPGQGLKLPGQGLKLAGQGLVLPGAGITLAGAGRSLKARRKTRATKLLRKKRKAPKIDLMNVRMGMKGLGRKNPKRVAAGKKAAKKNKWAQHLKKTFAQNKGISFKDGVQLASATFKR